MRTNAGRAPSSRHIRARYRQGGGEWSHTVPKNRTQIGTSTSAVAARFFASARGILNGLSRPVSVTRDDCPSGRYAAVGAGGRRPSSSRSRTRCCRSGASAASPPPAANSGTADIAVDRGGGWGPRPPTGGKHRPGPIERLLLVGSTGRCRPSADIQSPKSGAVKQSMESRHVSRAGVTASWNRTSR